MSLSSVREGVKTCSLGGRVLCIYEMLPGFFPDYFYCGVEFCSKSAFEELHVMLSRGPPCIVASGRQRRGHNNTSVFLLRQHLRGWGKNAARCGCSPSGDQPPGLKKGLGSLAFSHGSGRPESKRSDVRSVGNLEINCWVQKKLAKSCHKVGKACLDCLQRDLRLRGAKPLSTSLEWTCGMAECPG